MEPPQTANISAGSFNHMDDTDLAHGLPQTRAQGGVGVRTQIKVIRLLPQYWGVWVLLGVSVGLQ